MENFILIFPCIYSIRQYYGKQEEIRAGSQPQTHGSSQAGDALSSLRYMRLEVNIKYINQYIAKNIKRETNPISRFLPLFIKNPILLFLYKINDEAHYTSSFSNMGSIVMPSGYSEHIEKFEFLPPPGPITRINCSDQKKQSQHFYFFCGSSDSRLMN